MNLTKQRNMWNSIEKMRDEFLKQFRDLIIIIMDNNDEVCRYVITFEEQFNSFKEEIR